MKKHPEYQYLDTLRLVRDTGEINENRTGVNTRRILGVTHRYDFQDGFPLFTTKRVWWKGVAHELLWFLSGSSNIKYLLDNGVGIWTDDAYRVYKEGVAAKNKWIDQQNERRKSSIPHIDTLSKDDWIESVKAGTRSDRGELGPVYGVQWRHWGYTHDEVCGYEEVDQVAQLIHDLKNNPQSRRHIISAWKVDEIPRMGLPPCHVMSQYTVSKGKLWCHMYQRSCDMFLGVPFNVASYSLLTHILARVCDLEPGGFIHTMHDCHIYENHLDAVEEQLSREPNPFPQLVISPGVSNIDDISFGDLQIVNYNPHKAIKAELNVG